jgi:hypothetical protein
MELQIIPVQRSYGGQLRSNGSNVISQPFNRQNGADRNEILKISYRIKKSKYLYFLSLRYQFLT